VICVSYREIVDTHVVNADSLDLILDAVFDLIYPEQLPCELSQENSKSSIRKIQIDWRTVVQFSELVRGLPEDQPIFVSKHPYNSTVNAILARHCRKAGVPVITIHGLRHTHASILLFAGVSIASVARRLGHSNINTTQKTYLHIIQELENKDVNIVMRSLSELD